MCGAEFWRIPLYRLSHWHSGVFGIGLALFPIKRPETQSGENFCRVEVVMSFLDKLFKKGFRASTQDPNVAQDSLSPVDTHTDQYAPLWELQKQRQLLEVKIGGASRAYQS